MNQKPLLTAQKVAELKAEAEKIEKVEKPQLADRLNRLRSTTQDEFDSTLSEVLEEKSAIEKRLLEVKELIANHQLLDETKTAKKVEIGTKVKLKAPNGLLEYRVVETIEADPLNGKISPDSPIGRSLLGKKVGEEFLITINGQAKSYKIENICF